MNKVADTAVAQVALSTVSVPRIGEYWPGQGGKFIGICKGESSQPDYLLIEHVEELPRGPWQKALEAAKALEADGHQDFSLPNRAEAALLYANAKDDHDGWYWTSEEHASASGFAWGQYFYDGCQVCSGKGFTSRARAVRRVPGQAVEALDPISRKWRPARVERDAPYPRTNCGGAYVLWADLPTPAPSWMSSGGWQSEKCIREAR